MRLGIDLGGTKTEIVALDGGRQRCCAAGWRRPQDYNGTARALAELVAAAEAELGARGSVGMAIPGTRKLGTDLIKNANTT